MSGYNPLDPIHNVVLVYGAPPTSPTLPDFGKQRVLPQNPFPIVPEDPFTGDPLQTYIDMAKEIARLKDENAQYMVDKIHLMNQIAELEERERQLIVGCKAAEDQIVRLQDKLTKGKRTRGNVP